jgi:hypothetical protein
VIVPLVTWRDSGLVVPTDFTSLVDAWQTVYGGEGYLYDAEAAPLGVSDAPSSSAVLALAPGAPNPVRTETLLRYSLAREAHVRLSIFDIFGRRVATLADEPSTAGDHAVRWDASQVPAGAYVCRLEELGGGGGSSQTRKLLVVR